MRSRTLQIVIGVLLLSSLILAGAARIMRSGAMRTHRLHSHAVQRHPGSPV